MKQKYNMKLNLELSNLNSKTIYEVFDFNGSLCFTGTTSECVTYIDERTSKLAKIRYFDKHWYIVPENIIEQFEKSENKKEFDIYRVDNFSKPLFIKDIFV